MRSTKAEGSSIFQRHAGWTSRWRSYTVTVDHRVSREEAEEVAVDVVLVEARVAGEGDAELGHAGLDAVVAAVDGRVAVKAAVLHAREGG